MIMLTGEYNHQLDAKNRMRIPAKLRKELGEEYYFAKGSNRCIFVFPREEVEAKLEKLREIKISDVDKQKALRAFTKSVTLAVEDTQGRLVLSPELRSYIGLEKSDKDLVICGTGTRAEIWSKKVYDEYFADLNVNYDKLLSELDI